MAVERLPCGCGHSYSNHAKGKRCSTCDCSRWTGGWRARWRDASGRAYSKGSKNWTKRDAEAYERKMLQQRDQGIVVKAGDMTVADLASLWMEASRHIAENTRRNRDAEIRNGIIPHLGSVKLSKLSAAHIDLYISRRKEDGLSPSTMKANLDCVMNPMLNFAVRRRYMPANPASEVEKPRVEKTERRFLSMDELNQLADAFPDQWKGLVLFAGVMGTRFSETWDLRPDHVSGSNILIPGTKSKSSLRRIEMPKFIQNIVTKQIAKYSTETCLWGDRDRKSWRMGVWYPCVRASGVGPVRFHDLRHTAASLMIKAGLHAKTIQYRLGHSSITITFDEYGHLFKEVDAAAAADLDRLWNEE
jgi:integrase